MYSEFKRYNRKVQPIQIGYDINDKLVVYYQKPLINELRLGNKKLKKLNLLNISRLYKILHLEYNYLTELIIPEGTVMLYCNNNQIKDIYLPLSLRFISLDHDVKILNFDEIVKNGNCLIKYFHKHPNYIKYYL